MVRKRRGLPLKKIATTTQAVRKFTDNIESNELVFRLVELQFVPSLSEVSKLMDLVRDTNLVYCDCTTMKKDNPFFEPVAAAENSFCGGPTVEQPRPSSTATASEAI